MTPPRRTPPRAALVFNPVKVNERRLQALVARIAVESGWDTPLFFSTTIEDAGQGATRDAISAGASVVLVAGGDGTVRAASEAIAGTGVPLAIVPSGTGNLLARNVGLPLTGPEPMVRAAFGGNHLPVDIGWARLHREDGSAQERAFVVLAGIGLDAEMIAKTRDGLKKSIGWVAYIDGAARSLPGAKPFRISFTHGASRTHSPRVQSVLFANCGALPAGIALIPGASITDGILDVAIFQPSGPLGWLGVWRKVWWDNSVLRRFRAGRRVLQRRGRDTSVHYYTGATASASVRGSVAVELDGDECGRVMRIDCRVDAGALVLAVPAGHSIESR